MARTTRPRPRPQPRTRGFVRRFWSWLNAVATWVLVALWWLVRTTAKVAVVLVLVGLVAAAVYLTVYGGYSLLYPKTVVVEKVVADMEVVAENYFLHNDNTKLKNELSENHRQLTVLTAKAAVGANRRVAALLAEPPKASMPTRELPPPAVNPAPEPPMAIVPVAPPTPPATVDDLPPQNIPGFIEGTNGGD